MLQAQVNSFVLDITNGIRVKDVRLFSSTPLKVDTFVQARRDGGKTVSAFYQPKTISITGMIEGTSWNDLTTKIDALNLAIAGTNNKFYFSDGILCKMWNADLVGEVVIDRKGNNISACPFSFQLVASDPPFGQEATLGVGAISTNALTDPTVTLDVYTNSLSFGGSATPTPKITITFTTPGDINGIDIVDKTNSRILNVPQSFSTGDVLVIDTSIPSVKVNNVSVNYTGQFPTWGATTCQIGLNFYTVSGVNLDQSQKLSNDQSVLYATTTRIAQQFTPTATAPLSRISFIANKVGTPTGDITVRIETDSSGSPSGTLVTGGSVTVTAASITGVFNWIDAIFSSSPPNLTTATPYWIVISCAAGNSVNNYYQIRTYSSQPYTGNLKTSANSGGAYATVTGYNLAFREFRSVIGQQNTAIAPTSYTENFATTTYKNGTVTVMNWDTANHRLILPKVIDTAFSLQTVGGSFDFGVGLLDYNYTGQSFTFTNDTVLTAVTVWMKKVGNPNLDVTLSCELDPSGTTTVPPNSGGTTAVVVAGSSITTTLAPITFTLPTPVIGYAGWKIWLKFGYTNFTSITGNADYYAIENSANNETSAGNPYKDAYGTTTAYLTKEIRFSCDGYHYDTSQITAQSTSYTSTLADVLSSVGTYVCDNTFAHSSFRLSSDGTNFPTNSLVQNSTNRTFFADIGSSLMWKTLDTHASRTDPDWITSITLTAEVGLALDATTKVAAQSFVPTSTGNIQRLDVYGFIYGTPGSMTLRIETDSAGSPSGTLVNAAATVTIPTTGLSDKTYGWITGNFASAFGLTSGTTYWIVAKAAATLDRLNKWGLLANNNGYTTGAMKRSSNSGTSYTAVTSGEDLLFRIFGASGGSYAVALSVDYTRRYL